jgi:hypothetical protein
LSEWSWSLSRPVSSETPWKLREKWEIERTKHYSTVQDYYRMNFICLVLGELELEAFLPNGWDWRNSRFWSDTEHVTEPSIIAHWEKRWLINMVSVYQRFSLKKIITWDLRPITNVLPLLFLPSPDTSPPKPTDLHLQMQVSWVITVGQACLKIQWSLSNPSLQIYYHFHTSDSVINVSPSVRYAFNSFEGKNDSPTYLSRMLKGDFLSMTNTSFWILYMICHDLSKRLQACLSSNQDHIAWSQELHMCLEHSSPFRIRLHGDITPLSAFLSHVTALLPVVSDLQEKQLRNDETLWTTCVYPREITQNWPLPERINNQIETSNTCFFRATGVNIRKRRFLSSRIVLRESDHSNHHNPEHWPLCCSETLDTSTQRFPARRGNWSADSPLERSGKGWMNMMDRSPEGRLSAV